MLKLLKLAGEYAIANYDDKRAYLLGAVGVREDGRLVHSRNEAIYDTNTRDKSGRFNIYKRFPESHAEVRLTGKLGFGADVYITRIARGTGEFAMARPCEICQSILKAFRIKKAYYTIDSSHYGIWYPCGFDKIKSVSS